MQSPHKKTIFSLVAQYFSAECSQTAGCGLPVAMLLRHNSIAVSFPASTGYVANAFRPLAQWVQLLARVEKVPMAGAGYFPLAKSIS
jgi:hypothetical protein